MYSVKLLLLCCLFASSLANGWDFKLPAEVKKALEGADETLKELGVEKLGDFSTKGLVKAAEDAAKEFGPEAQRLKEQLAKELQRRHAELTPALTEALQSADTQARAVGLRFLNEIKPEAIERAIKDPKYTDQLKALLRTELGKRNAGLAAELEKAISSVDTKVRQLGLESLKAVNIDRLKQLLQDPNLTADLRKRLEEEVARKGTEAERLIKEGEKRGLFSMCSWFGWNCDKSAQPAPQPAPQPAQPTPPDRPQTSSSWWSSWLGGGSSQQRSNSVNNDGSVLSRAEASPSSTDFTAGIVAGVLGGVALLALIAVIVAIVVHRRRQRQNDPAYQPASGFLGRKANNSYAKLARDSGRSAV